MLRGHSIYITRELTHKKKKGGSLSVIHLTCVFVCVWRHGETTFLFVLLSYSIQIEFDSKICIYLWYFIHYLFTMCVILIWFLKFIFISLPSTARWLFYFTGDVTWSGQVADDMCRQRFLCEVASSPTTYSPLYDVFKKQLRYTYILASIIHATLLYLCITEAIQSGHYDVCSCFHKRIYFLSNLGFSPSSPYMSKNLNPLFLFRNKKETG